MKIGLILCACMYSWVINAQEIKLEGTVSLQNSRTNTGQIIPIEGVRISHPNAKTTLSDSQGRFTLYLSRIKMGEQIALEVEPLDQYSSYVVVNELELKNITIGRKKSIDIYICPRKELDDMRAKWAGINIEKYKARCQEKINQLNQRIELLEKKNEYQSERYKTTLDSIHRIANDQKHIVKRIRTYTDHITLLNLDQEDSIVHKIYDFFKRAELDSLSIYLDENLDPEQQIEQIRKQEIKAQNDINLANSLRKHGDILMQNASEAKRRLANKLLIAARTYGALGHYDKAETYYNKLININPENRTYLHEVATYMFSLESYSKAEEYLTKALNIRPKSDIDLAKTRNILGAVFQKQGEHLKAIEQLNLALNIWETNPENQKQQYRAERARTISNIAVCYDALSEYDKAIQLHLKALEIREQLAQENSQAYSSDLAKTYNLLGAAYNHQQKYSMANIFLKKAVTLSREILQEGNPKIKTNLIKALNNLGFHHTTTSNELYDSEVAEKYLREALDLCKQMNKQAPQIYLDDLARINHNLALCLAQKHKPTEAIVYINDAINIRAKLNAKIPNKYKQKLLKSKKTIPKSIFSIEGRVIKPNFESC